MDPSYLVDGKFVYCVCVLSFSGCSSIFNFLFRTAAVESDSDSDNSDESDDEDVAGDAVGDAAAESDEEETKEEEEPVDEEGKRLYWVPRHWKQHQKQLVCDYTRAAYVLSPNQKVQEHAKANPDPKDKCAVEHLLKKLHVPSSIT